MSSGRLLFAPSNQPIGGTCRLLVQSPVIVLDYFLTDAGGSAAQPFPIPNDPTNIGLQVFLQWGVFDPNGQAFGAFAASDALRMFVGN